MKTGVIGNLGLALVLLFGIFTVFRPVSGQEETLVDLLSPEARGMVMLEGRDLFSFEGVTDGGLKDQVLSLPFKTDPGLERANFDASVSLDLSRVDTFLLGLTFENPKALGMLTLYFRSGNGWYSLGGRGKTHPEPGVPCQFAFSRASARIEGTPAGWDKIDGFRLAFWRGGMHDSSVRIEHLRAKEESILVLLADPDSEGESREVGESFLKLLRKSEFSVMAVDAGELTAEKLQGRRTVLVPINPHLSESGLNLIEKYLDGGGFLYLFYSQPDRLMKMLGFKTGSWFRPAERGRELAEIRFYPEYAAEFGALFPPILVQKSHNIVPAIPLPDDQLDEFLRKPENRPRAVAQWYDSRGEKTDWPAIYASGRGVYWTHILMWDGWENKARYLLTTLGRNDPELRRALVCRSWSELLAIGQKPDESTAAFRKSALKEILPQLAKEKISADDLRLVLLGDAKPADFDRVYEALEKLRDERIADYCRSIPSKKGEKRLWWEHSGCGAYPGDWDKTMKELAESGFSGVVTNALWGGGASYASDVLPRDSSFEKYGDQIAQAVAAGKKYGVEVHIWKVNFNCGRGPKEFVEKMEKEGRLQKSIRGVTQTWLCPSHPLNRKLEADAMLEVATRYGVDGIHFDYIRYDGGEYCYCDGCRERFSADYQKATGKELTGWPNSTISDPEIREIYQQWRRDQITALVREVRRRVDTERPECQISAAVFSSYPNCRGGIAQDWGAWVEEGLLDFICPMDYTSDANRFVGMIETQKEIIRGKIPLYPGIGATSTGNALRPDEVALQIELTRTLGADGFTIFNLSAATAKKYLPLLREGPTSKK